jgi:hypothetical protein
MQTRDIIAQSELLHETIVLCDDDKLEKELKAPRKESALPSLDI